MNNRIYLSSPDVGLLEEEYILSALRSGWVAPLGPDVDAFESEMAERIGVRHAVALSSGTAALHVALAAWGVSRGDVVITSTMTFAATANAIAYTGAEPYFIDCDRTTGNMDVGLLEQALLDLTARGERVAAIVPVDLLGKAVDYTRIVELARAFGVPVLSDAAESLGATHRGRPTGSFGDASVFSFNGNKIMTTSGGGMLMTDHDDLASRVRYLATQARQPVVHYEHVDIGYNYRLSNLLAALGRAQLSRLDEMIGRRRDIRNLYRGFFSGVAGVEIFGGADDDEDNVWLTSVTIDVEQTGWRPDELSEWLASDGIESRPLWKPMHLQPVFAESRSLINGSSEKIFRSGITLPSGSVLSSSDMLRVMEKLASFIESR